MPHPPLPSGYDVRLARPDEDLERLQDIDRSASREFIPYGLDERFWGTATAADTFAQASRRGLLWVAVDASDQPVGFALMRQVDGAAHLDELGVHPTHGRRGLGTALVETVCEWARERGYRAVTLSTLRDVPFNGPFYARLGFAEIPEAEPGPELKALREREAAAGFPMHRRVLMRRAL